MLYFEALSKKEKGAITARTSEDSKKTPQNSVLAE
jgi:hypothetical protein